MSNVNSDRHHLNITRIRAGRDEPIINFPESYHLLREVTLDVRIDPIGSNPQPTSGALTYEIWRYRNTLESIRSYDRDKIASGTILGFAAIAAASNGVTWNGVLSMFDEFVLVNGTDVDLYGFSLDFDPLRIRQETVTETRILRGESRQAILFDRGRDRHE